MYRIIDVYLSLGLLLISLGYLVADVVKIVTAHAGLEPVLVMTCVSCYFLRDTRDSLREYLNAKTRPLSDSR